MNTEQTHSDRAGANGKACDTCGSVFASRRAWARFCDSRCRNAFHQAEARVEAIRAAAPRLYEALRSIAANGAPAAADFAAEAIKDLRPPVEPKALLDKGKG